MTNRQYNDAEVAAIFERASKAEHTTLPVPAESQGFTLVALQAIGREVGLSAESISHAARSLDQAGQPVSRKLMGLPIGVGRTVEFDRPLSDSDWERLVADLRDTFEARGTVRYDGPFRQWTNGNLSALVEPIPNGYRFRLQTVKGDSRTLMTGGAAVLGLAPVVLIAGAVAGSLNNSDNLAGVAFMAVMGLGIFAAGALRVRSWARQRTAQIEQVFARLALATAAPPQPTLPVGEDPRPSV